MQPSAMRLPFLVAALVAACATYVEGQVENALIEALPRVLGPADRYGATVEGPNRDASHFDRVHAVGVRVRRPVGPVVEQIEVDLQDVSVDRQNKRITRIGGARATVRVKASDLTAYLAQQNWVSQPSVRLLPSGGVIVSGLFRVPGLDLATGPAAEFRGRLVPDGSRLLVAIDSLHVGERDAPALWRGLLATAVNPLIDLSAFVAPSRIDWVSVQGDSLVLEASGSRCCLE